MLSRLLRSVQIFRSNSVYKQLHVQNEIEKRERGTHMHTHTRTHAHTLEFSQADADTYTNSHKQTHTHCSKGVQVAIITKEILGVMLTAPVGGCGPTAA